MTFLPILLGTLMLILYGTGVVPPSYQLTVRLVGVYLPAFLGTFCVILLSCKLRVNTKLENISTVSMQKQNKVSTILAKWNEAKFNSVGFSWSYDGITDCLELNVDSNLELAENQPEGFKK